jgi:hypothetical protein
MSRKRRGSEEMVSGLAIAGVTAVLYFVLGQGWWWLVFPFVFAGVLPFVRGLQRLIAERPRKTTPAEREARDEKDVLMVARDSSGIVTPAIVALKSALTTERAEQVLQRMVTKGYAAMEVTDRGNVEYHFPEFRRQIDS